MARITLTPTKVVWSDFEQPHRAGRNSARPWDYGAFALSFDRSQYMSSLRAVDAAVREWRATRAAEDVYN
jgi:hypothetical protein